MIISCSRRSDIPAFYSDWFFNRLREGFAQVRNSVNPQQVRRISLAPANVDCIVFWTKDPAPLLDRLSLLNDFTFYFQFTLTPYGPDCEPHLPPKKEIIDTFMRLSDKIGNRRIIWRYDPILLSEKINVDYHVDHFGNMAQRLAGHTEKCVISFIDIYRHIVSRMAGLGVRTPDESEMRTLVRSIARIARGCGIDVETCAEEIDLGDLGIAHGRCIDDRLISELSGKKLNIAKDKYQRKLCGCATSVDIGAYNTCRHSCCYCYANINPGKLEKNLSRHCVQSPLLIREPL
ncbi:MAG: DUF1848 domain-containing protein [Deltaproteobacteria bacterium]|nr:DUF1848 domain-containing protein [Deltaproteobacteria bacterium]